MTASGAQGAATRQASRGSESAMHSRRGKEGCKVEHMFFTKPEGTAKTAAAPAFKPLEGSQWKN